MSHWFEVNTVLSNKNAIIKAANQMRFLVGHNKMCRGYNGQQTKCDLVMALPGQYDVGFQKQNDGSYNVVADFFMDHISQYLANPDYLQKAEKTCEEKRNAKEWDSAQAEAYLASAKLSKFMQTYNQCAVEELIQQQGLQYIEAVQNDGTIILEVIGQQGV